MGFDEKFKQEIHEIKENENFTFVGHQIVENLYQINKETTDKLIQSLNDQVTTLKSEIHFLREQLKRRPE